MISRVQHKQPAVSHKAIYVDVLGCCTYVYVLGLPTWADALLAFRANLAGLAWVVRKRQATVGGPRGGPQLGGQVLWLWLRPIEAAVQGAKGKGTGQPAAGTCFPSSVRGNAAKAVSGQMDEIFPPGSSQVCVFSVLG